MRSGGTFGRPPARVIGRVRLGLFALATILLVVLLTRAGIAIVDGGLTSAAGISPAAIAIACLLYLVSHGVRIARLALLVGDSRVSLRHLTSVHLFTAGVSLGLPFKLGDVYRVVEISAMVGGFLRGLTIVFVERGCDVALILLLLVVVLLSGPADAGRYAPVLVASLLFVSATLLLAVLLPDNLRRFGSYIIRRYDQPWSVATLRQIADMRQGIAAASNMLTGRYLSLFAFTLVIWILEASSLGVIIAAHASDLQPLAALLTFLSSITTGETLLDRLSSGQIPSAMPTVAAYLIATQLPLVVMGFFAGLRLAAIAITGVGRQRGDHFIMGSR